VTARFVRRALVAALGLAVVVAVVQALALRPSSPRSTSQAATTTARTSRSLSATTIASVPSTEPSTSSLLLDASEPPTNTAPTALPPRPTDVRLDPARLASRFVAEWLTYPPGLEASSSLALRLSELITARYRTVIEGLSTAGVADRPGSVAELGATTALDEPGVYRVTTWQALYGTSSELVGPYSWDVTVVRDLDGDWRVDGLRRAG
jgi:hypothetical protein